MNKKPELGKLLYQEKIDDNGKLLHAALLFIDEESEDENDLYVTWIVQMEDFNGNGLEVYITPEAGGSSLSSIDRLATDEDLLSFVKVIMESTDSENKLEEWRQSIRTNQDYSTLDESEKVRLEKLLIL